MSVKLISLLLYKFCRKHQSMSARNEHKNPWRSPSELPVIAIPPSAPLDEHCQRHWTSSFTELHPAVLVLSSSLLHLLVTTAQKQYTSGILEECDLGQAQRHFGHHFLSREALVPLSTTEIQSPIKHCNRHPINSKFPASPCSVSSRQCRVSLHCDRSHGESQLTWEYLPTGVV
jgi:hypothetical protein